jgi:hypothetical protein
MYLKLTNNSCRFHSPSKMNGDKCTFPYGGSGALGALQQKNLRLGIQYAEKMSQRLDMLKREDPILNYDLIIVFTNSLASLKTNLNLPQYEVLMQFLPNGPDQYDQQLRS